jgi:phosphoribosyl 1,2-cyclic phosphodiesterase
MKALDFKLDNIAGCLVTHAHMDHAHSVEWLLDNGIDVYASEDTFKALDESLHLHRRAKVIEPLYGTIIADTFRAFPFPVEHDVEGAYGYVVETGGWFNWKESLLFITDTMMVKQKFALEFNIIAICCNYDKDILNKRVEDGTINETYAKRLLESHMEKETTKDYLRKCNLGKCTEIHLLHMSGHNTDKEKIRAEIEKEFFIKTIIAGENNAKS